MHADYKQADPMWCKRSKFTPVYVLSNFTIAFTLSKGNACFNLLRKYAFELE